MITWRLNVHCPKGHINTLTFEIDEVHGQALWTSPGACATCESLDAIEPRLSLRQRLELRRQRRRLKKWDGAL